MTESDPRERLRVRQRHGSRACFVPAMLELAFPSAKFAGKRTPRVETRERPGSRVCYWQRASALMWMCASAARAAACLGAF